MYRVIQGRCRATRNFRGGREDDLCFSKGEIIYILKTGFDDFSSDEDDNNNNIKDENNSEWWLGQLQDYSTGYFPSVYVEEIKNKSNTQG